ncbi:hypothetical protein CBL_05566 [Carabus blaptoides fortunei]
MNTVFKGRTSCVRFPSPIAVGDVVLSTKVKYEFQVCMLYKCGESVKNLVMYKATGRYHVTHVNAGGYLTLEAASIMEGPSISQGLPSSTVIKNAWNDGVLTLTAHLTTVVVSHFLELLTPN